MLQWATLLSPCCCAWRKMSHSVPTWTSRWIISNASSRQERASLGSFARKSIFSVVTMKVGVLMCCYCPCMQGLIGNMQEDPGACITCTAERPLHSDCHACIWTEYEELQDKLQRTQVLECIVLCTESFLRRNSQHGSEAAADRWLAKSTKPVMAHLRKGSFQFQEQQVCCCLAVCTCKALCFWSLVYATKAWAALNGDSHAGSAHGAVLRPGPPCTCLWHRDPTARHALNGVFRLGRTHDWPASPAHHAHRGARMEAGGSAAQL